MMGIGHTSFLPFVKKKAYQCLDCIISPIILIIIINEKDEANKLDSQISSICFLFCISQLKEHKSLRI